MEYNIFKIPSQEPDKSHEIIGNNKLLVFNDTPLTAEAKEGITKLVEALNIENHVISDDCLSRFASNRIPLNVILKSNYIEQIWYFGDIHTSIDLSLKVPEYQKFSLLEKEIIVAADFNKIILSKELKLKLWRELQLMNYKG